MGENHGVSSKCYINNRSSYLGVGLLTKKQRRKSCRPVSMVSLIKRGLYKLDSVAAGCCILSMTYQEESKSIALESSKQRRVPVFTMMPVDAFGVDATGVPKIRRLKALTMSLKAIKLAGVHGVAVDVWWGIVEHDSPFVYNWFLYEELFKIIFEAGLKLHVSLSFHSSMGTPSNPKSYVSLPLWVTEIGFLNRDIYYRDQNGYSNDDYLTLGVDHVPLFCGRTALQCYEDFIFSFITKFESLMGGTIEEISIGLGPSGELRYPAHPFHDGRWRFPGIGEFQCYDKYMMEDLKLAACQAGKPEWGDKGPQNAGGYNSLPFGVPFFEEGDESFLSDYGHFFLEWYSGKLIKHADAILAKAADMLGKYQDNRHNYVLLVAKIAGIYWWYQTNSHAAELTAGYYNTALRDGYDPLVSILSKHGAALHISCLEMLDSEIPSTYLCSPEGLLEQLWRVSKKRIICLTGRNAKERFDKAGLRQIMTNCHYRQEDSVRSFTYFRMSEKNFRVENWNNFVLFVKQMSKIL